MLTKKITLILKHTKNENKLHERNRTGTLERSAIIRPRHPEPMEGVQGQQRDQQAAGKGSANRNPN